MIKVLIMALMLSALSFAEDDDGMEIIELDEITEMPKNPIVEDPIEPVQESESEESEEEVKEPEVTEEPRDPELDNEIWEDLEEGMDVRDRHGMSRDSGWGRHKISNFVDDETVKPGCGESGDGGFCWKD